MSRKPLPARVTDPHYLARPLCAYCAGTGKREGIGTCHCVYRAVTANCLESLQKFSCVHPNCKVFTRRAEFAAEIELIARRTLVKRELGIWHRYFVAEEPWHAVDRKTGLGRGAFFHLVYRIAEKMGSALAASTVWPAATYFAGLSHDGLSIRPAIRHTAKRKSDPTERS